MGVPRRGRGAGGRQPEHLPPWISKSVFGRSFQCFRVPLKVFRLFFPSPMEKPKICTLENSSGGQWFQRLLVSDGLYFLNEYVKRYNALQHIALD